jgi:hypothetical protein
MSWYKLNNHWTKKIMSNNFRLLNLSNENTIENILCHVFLKKIRTTRVKKFVVNYLNSISDEDFIILQENYLKEYNLKNILWNPLKIMENKKVFIREIKGPHFTFKKDDTTLYLISRAFDFDMIIFNDTTNTILDIHDDDFLKNNLIVLYTTDKNIFDANGVQKRDVYLLGLKTDDKRKKNLTLFSRDTIPESLSKILNVDDLYIQHINQILSGTDCNQKITLNYILKELKTLNLLQTNDTKTLIPIITELLNDKKFFCDIKD